MTWTVPSDLRNPEPTPDHDDPSTWRTCLAVPCHVRVDPWDHQFRCSEHRRPVELDVRHVSVATSSSVAEQVATETLYDPAYPRRLLDAVVADAPNLVARVMLQIRGTAS